MTSTLTNTAALSALSLLAGTRRALGRVQDQVSTGLRVASASDNAAYWSIGVGMRSEVAALGAVDTGLDLVAAIVSVTDTAVAQVIHEVDGIQADLVTAQSAGADPSAVQADVAARQRSIVQAAEGASFDGVNWLVQRKAADVTITETHSVQATYADLVAEEAANVMDRGPMPTYAAPSAPGPDAVVTSGALPPGFAFQDQVDYVATAQETDAAGTALSETTHFDGTDTDRSYMMEYWVSSFGGDAQWNEGAQLEPSRIGTEAVSAADDTDTGNVDFSGHQDAVVPSASAGPGSAPALSIDTSRFALFTDYTGSVQVTEGGSYLGGTDAFQGSPVPIYGHDGGHQSTTPYASYAVDNGFEEDPGALDANVFGVDGSTSRTVAPEDDLGTATKTTVLNVDVTGLRRDQLAGMQTAVEDDLASLRAIAAKLGGIATLIATRKTYDAALAEALTAGIGSLVDADMDVASTRLHALQAQQQLGLRALSIANADGALVLRLFQQES